MQALSRAAAHRSAAVVAARSSALSASGVLASSALPALAGLARLPTAMAAGVVGVRRMGILDRLKSGIAQGFSEKTEAKKQELFQFQLDTLISSPTYTLADHQRTMTTVAEKAGILNPGWKGLLMSKDQEAEREEQLLDIKILGALTPAEIADHTIMHRREKLRVAAAVPCDVARVNKCLDGYEQSAIVHRWVLSRKARGLPLPKSLPEFQSLMATDRQGMGLDRKTQMQKMLGNVRNNRAMMLRAGVPMR